MRILGFAGLLIALAIVGYLIVGYLAETGKAQQAVPGFQPAQPADLTRKGLEQRLSPILDQERKRVEEATKAAGQ